MLLDSEPSSSHLNAVPAAAVPLRAEHSGQSSIAVNAAPESWRSLHHHGHVSGNTQPTRDHRLEHSGDGDAGSLPRPQFSALDVRDRVVIMLLFKQIVSTEDVEASWQRWYEQTGGRSQEPLWRVLARDGAFDRDKILAEAARAEGIQQLALDVPAAVKFIESSASLFSEGQWRQLFGQNLVPVERQERTGRLIFVSPDPSHPNVSRLLREVGAGDYVLRFVPEAIIDRITTALTTDLPEDEATTEATVPAHPAVERSTALGAIRGKADRTLTHCLTDLVRRGATDLHLVFRNGRARAEMRIDGEVLPWQYASGPIERDLLDYLKTRISSGPGQDGRSPRGGSISQMIDGIRTTFDVSILPVAGSADDSESVVIRRSADSAPGRAESIKWPESVGEALARAVERRRGTILLAGQESHDTMSSVETVLRTLNAQGKRAITLDRAVSDSHPGILPIRLNAQLGSAAAIEAIRNHDPDVVIAGELHTKPAAELAFRLANAGHLVVGTMVALDAADAVGRLLAMHLDPMLPAYALELVVAQRTAKRLCPDCRVRTRRLDGEMLRRLGFLPRQISEAIFFEPGTEASCPRCHGSGFSGQLAVAQAMPISRAVRRLIALSDEAFHEDDLRALAVKEGMETLRASARALVARGETSVAELIRVTAGDA